MGEEQTGKSARRRILVVEDEPALRIGFQMSLSPEGFDVSTSENGDHALERIVDKGEHFDLVVTDLRMPIKCGAELVSEVKEAGIFLPWIVVSAWIDLPVVLQLVSCGVADFLMKPTTPDELRTTVEQVLREEKTYEDMNEPPEEKDEFCGWRHARIRRREWHRLDRNSDGFFNSEKSGGESGNTWQKVIDCVASHDGEVDPDDPALKTHPLFSQKNWFSALTLNA